MGQWYRGRGSGKYSTAGKLCSNALAGKLCENALNKAPNSIKKGLSNDSQITFSGRSCGEVTCSPLMETPFAHEHLALLIL